MRKIFMVLLAVVLIFSALGTAATVANADGGEGDPGVYDYPMLEWPEDGIYPPPPPPPPPPPEAAYGGAFCGSSCG